jgi:hypothetical protein
LTGRIEIDSFRLCCPAFADEFVWGEPFEGLQTSAEIVGGDEVSELLTELFVVVVVEALDRRVLDCAVHAFDLTIGPWMFRLCGAVLNVGLGAGIFESMGAENFPCGHCPFDQRDGGATGTRHGELDAIVGQYGVNLVGYGLEQAAQEAGRGCLVAFSCTSA